MADVERDDARRDTLGPEAAAAPRVRRLERRLQRAHARAPAHAAAGGEVADLQAHRVGALVLERERPREVARHPVVAERREQCRTRAPGARTELVEHAPDERRLARRVEVHRTRVDRGLDRRAAVPPERPDRRDQHVARPDQRTHGPRVVDVGDRGLERRSRRGARRRAPGLERARGLCAVTGRRGGCRRDPCRRGEVGGERVQAVLGPTREHGPCAAGHELVRDERARVARRAEEHDAARRRGRGRGVGHGVTSRRNQGSRETTERCRGSRVGGVRPLRPRSSAARVVSWRCGLRARRPAARGRVARRRRTAGRAPAWVRRGAVVRRRHRGGAGGRRRDRTARRSLTVPARIASRRALGGACRALGGRRRGAARARRSAAPHSADVDIDVTLHDFDTDVV